MTRLHMDMATGQIIAKPSKGRSRPTHPGVAKELAANRSGLDEARKLATSLGVQISNDGQGGWWVTCDTHFTHDSDPLQGNNFCSSGQEVLDAVKTYATALAPDGRNDQPEQPGEAPA